MTDVVNLTGDVARARARLVEFVDGCTAEQWASSPLGDGVPRSVGVIVDHVADAYEYLATWVGELARGDAVEVSSEIIDDLNARHAQGISAPTRPDAVDHLQRSGDAFIALVESLSPVQLSGGDGRIVRFAQIAARHADSHVAELDAALR